MRKLSGLAALLMSCCAAVAQTPVVSTVVNAASNLPPGLPNAGIAQGALMILYGSGLGPSTLTVVPKYPIPTTLEGTSVRITMGGTNIDTYMYYTSATQVAAIVPSTTPAGTGTVMVTYNDKVSAAVPITVVQNNVGLYTVNSQGTDTAVVTFSDYSYVTPSNAANPGEAVILWANGLGPIDGDDSQLPAGGDLTNVPLEVLIGGKTAKVLYHGRNTCCASLDQINVVVPDGLAGCRTPIVLKIGNLVSNTASIPIAASGRACTTIRPSAKAIDYQTLVTQGKVTIGAIAMLRSNIMTTGAGNAITTTLSDAGSARFYRYTQPYAYAVGGLIDGVPPGSCQISIIQSGGAASPVTSVSLDAGTAISVAGPNGTKTYAKQSGAGFLSYSGSFGTGFFDPGPYVISGPGGPDVGIFSANATFSKAFTWNSQASFTSVDRASGVTVTWSGDTGELVGISGQSTAATSDTTSVSARFDCTAKGSDGTFTLPPEVLLALPATGKTLGTLTVNNVSYVPFTAPGIDYGFVYYGTQGLNLDVVTYR